MNTFVAFTETRKQQIDHLRNRVMIERPYMEKQWNGDLVKRRVLGLPDFTVYAALRGADYRKGDHTGGKEATAALKRVISLLAHWKNSDSHVGKKAWARWLPEAHTDVELGEMIQALSDELAKWENA